MPIPSVPQTLWHFASMLRIAHHIPGRVRLKLDGPENGSLAQVADQIATFCRSADGIAGIRSVKLNLLARSCTVEYDATIITPDTWEDLVAGKGSPAVDTLLTSLAAS